MIHSASPKRKLAIDPQGRPTDTAGSDYLVSVRPSVPHFSNLAIVIATGGTVGIAEWIIDGTHVLFCLNCLSFECESWRCMEIIFSAVSELG